MTTFRGNIIILEKKILLSRRSRPCRWTATIEQSSALMTGYRIKKRLLGRHLCPGINILAAPIRLVLNDGKNKPAETEFNFTKLANTEVATKTLLQNEMLSANIKQSYDYDGMCKLNITLTPKGSNVKLQSAFIELPLKPEIAS